MNDMTCADARELLLEAEPAELAGIADSPLAHHLRSCDACAAEARAVLAAQAELAHALDTLAGDAARAALPAVSATSVPAARAALPAVSATSVPAARDETGVVDIGRSRMRRDRERTRPSRRWLLAAAAPLAAAAVLLLTLWRGDLLQESTTFEPILLPPEHVSQVAVVNAPAGRDVAVLRTSDPNITIIWQLGTERTQ